ncbi:hypothetical protein QQS21_012586 [Conoideocrella luteorostrata]|uniref:Uncharacterized protein n=1 Tax=Conoideocrella luteorostrata TaxID=1105319 RepID=A0AAJ0FMI9_9HYPO|nr:hypothetical protein QQS21_012586 [Conoideocrella luteorostrata]
MSNHEYNGNDDVNMGVVDLTAPMNNYGEASNQAALNTHGNNNVGLNTDHNGTDTNANPVGDNRRDGGEPADIGHDEMDIDDAPVGDNLQDVFGPRDLAFAEPHEAIQNDETLGDGVRPEQSNVGIGHPHVSQMYAHRYHKGHISDDDGDSGIGSMDAGSDADDNHWGGSCWDTCRPKWKALHFKSQLRKHRVEIAKQLIAGLQERLRERNRELRDAKRYIQQLEAEIDRLKGRRGLRTEVVSLLDVLCDVYFLAAEIISLTTSRHGPGFFPPFYEAISTQ